MILVAGSANLDFVVQVNHIPAPGETVLGHDLALFPGGKGANQAIACARSGGVKTEMLLALGNDWFAEPIALSLSEAGVKMHQVKVSDKRTGTAFISVSDDAENAITVAPGANNALTSSDLPVLTDYTHLLLQLEIPIAVVTEYARIAKAQGLSVVLNAAPAQVLPQELISLIDLLIVNEGELAVVADCEGSVSNCLERLDVPTVVVTLGSRGCCALQNSEFTLQPGFSVKAQDTTAAGDSFCGVLVAALSEGNPLQKALNKASAAGALACTKLGAQASIPSLTAVNKFLQHVEDFSTSKVDNLREYCGFTQAQTDNE